MQKWEGKSINCSENHSLLGLGSLERVSTWRYKRSRPGSQEKKTLLSFNSQKKTNTICLSLRLLISLKTKPALRGTEAKRKGGDGQKLTFLLLAGSRILATRPGKQDAKCPACPQSLSSPGLLSLRDAPQPVRSCLLEGFILPPFSAAFQCLLHATSSGVSGRCGRIWTLI